LEDIDSIIKAYELYTEQMLAGGIEPQLSFTRAWRLVKFMDNHMLTQTQCSCCDGQFVTEPYDL
jgi:flagellar transcriptional activator FlhC